MDETTFSEELRGVIPKRYQYTNISDYIDRKAKMFGSILEGISGVLVDEVYSIDTCSVSALRNYWMKLYGVKPSYVSTIDDTIHVLTDDEARIVVKLRAFASCWDGTTYQLNAFIPKLFKDRGNVFVTDEGSMKFMFYTFFFELPEWEKDLYTNYDILPRNAGVKSAVQYVTTEVFGFDKSELYPFNQRPFFPYSET